MDFYNFDTINSPDSAHRAVRQGFYLTVAYGFLMLANYMLYMFGVSYFLNTHFSNFSLLLISLAILAAFGFYTKNRLAVSLLLLYIFLAQLYNILTDYQAPVTSLDLVFAFIILRGYVGIKKYHEMMPSDMQNTNGG